MRVLLIVVLMQTSLVWAHHSHNHLGGPVEPDMPPPDDLNYLWWALFPVLLVLAAGLVRAWLRYRRKP